MANKSHFSSKASSKYCPLPYGQPMVCTDIVAVLRLCPIMKMEDVLDSFVCKQVMKKRLLHLESTTHDQGLPSCLYAVVKTECKEWSKSSEVVYLSNIQMKNNVALPAA